MKSDCESESDDCCTPALASSQYGRGPTDTNPAMNPQERAYAAAIEARCGKSTPEQQTKNNTGNKFSGPGNR